MITSLIDAIYFSLGVYSFILILVGTTLNLLCFYIFKRLVPNRSNATIIAFSYVALIELLIPFTWNLNYVVRELLWKHRQHSLIRNLEQHSLFICKFISYGAYFSLQCAAWLKTVATATRYISLHHEWSISKHLAKPILIPRMIWIVIVAIGMLNLPVWLVHRPRVSSSDPFNRTFVQIKCYQSILFQFWEIEHLLMYNFIPFTLMISCNILVIRHVHASRRRTQRSKPTSSALAKVSQRPLSSGRRSISQSGARLTQTLIFITVFFILLTAPSAIFYIFLGKIIKRHRNLITMGLSNLATTSHVSSFIIYWMTSTDFRDAAISLIYCRSGTIPKQAIEEMQQDRRAPIRPSLSPVVLSSDASPENVPLTESARPIP